MMSGLELRKLGRDLARDRGRFGLACLALWVGLVAGGALLDSWAWMRDLTQRHYAASLPVHATVHLERLDAAALERVRRRADVAAVRGARHVAATIEVDGAPRRAMLISFDDFQRGDIGRLAPERGAWPPAGGASIERSSLEFSGATVGRAIDVRVGERVSVPVPIVGVVRDVSQAPGWMEHVVTLFVDARTLEMLGVPGAADELQLRVRAPTPTRTEVRRIAQSVADDLAAAGYRVRRIDVPVPGEHVHAAQMNSLLSTQAAFAALTLLACALVVFDLFTALLAGQVREIAILKTLGAGPLRIAAWHLALAIVLGTAAALLAFGPAWWIGRTYARFRVELLNMPFDGAALPTWVIAAQLVAGGLIAAAAAAVPIARGCRLPVVDALRPPLHGRESSRRFTAPVSLSPAVRLALQNAVRRRGRAILTVGTLGFGMAVGLAAGNLQRGVLASVDRLYDSQRFDVALSVSGAPAPRALEERAAGVTGVQHVEAWSRARASADLGDGLQSDGFDVVGIPARTTAFVPRLEQGHWLSEEAPDGVVVSRALLHEDASIAVGRSLRVRIGAESYTWQVVGVVESGPQATVYTLRDGLRRATGATLVARVPGGAAAELAAIAALRETLGAAGYSVGTSNRTREGRRSIEDHLLMVVQFLGMATWLLVVIGGIGLATALASAVLERRREFAILRAVGAQHADIRRLVLLETAALTACAWLVALPMSVPMSVVLGDAFGRVMFPVPVRLVPTLAGSVPWALAAAAIALVAAWLPARQALRVPPAHALTAGG